MSLLGVVKHAVISSKSLFVRAVLQFRQNQRRGVVKASNSDEQKSPYETLELEGDADDEQNKIGSRRLANFYHPDGFSPRLGMQTSHLRRTLTVMVTFSSFGLRAASGTMVFWPETTLIALFFPDSIEAKKEAAEYGRDDI